MNLMNVALGLKVNSCICKMDLREIQLDGLSRWNKA